MRVDVPTKKKATLLPRPNQLVSVALKAPRLLYNLNLGWVLGHRFLLVTHQGRKSGLIHQTPLEVVRYDKATKTSIVISAWGETSDWYRNILKTPALQIQVGHERYVPEQRILSTDEAERELETYVATHGLSAKILARVFGVNIVESAGERRRFAERSRMVAFRPRNAGTA